MVASKALCLNIVCVACVYKALIFSCDWACDWDLVFAEFTTVCLLGFSTDVVLSLSLQAVKASAEITAQVINVNFIVFLFNHFVH